MNLEAYINWSPFPLDLVLSDCPGSAHALPNLNTSDHVIVLVILLTLFPLLIIKFITGLMPHGEDYITILVLLIGISQNQSVSFLTNVIVSATEKFAPSCILKLSRPTPWWNHACKTAWQ